MTNGSMRAFSLLLLVALLAACSIEPAGSLGSDGTPVALEPSVGQPITPERTTRVLTPDTATPTPITPSPTPTATVTNNATPEPTVDTRFNPAMRPGFEPDIETVAGIPRYELMFQIDPAVDRLSGSEQITFSNATSEPLANVALRLYPN